LQYIYREEEVDKVPIKYLEEEGDKFLVVDVSVPVDIRLAYQFLVELFQDAGDLY
jgi:hypothetical protein